MHLQEDIIAGLRGLASQTIIHIAFAFLAMGSWAVFANREYAMPAPLIAGVVQGALSASITFFMKQSLDWLRLRFDRAGYRIAALIAPPVLVCSVSLAGLVFIHWFASTPEIALTIAVPFCVAFTYAVVYNALSWSGVIKKHGQP